MSGTMKDIALEEIRAPPIKAIVATGVKLGQCGNSLKIAARAIAEITRTNFGCMFFMFFSIYLVQM